MDFPKLKKKANSFLLGEDGKISKKSVITTASLLVGATTITSLNAEIVSADNNLGLPDFSEPSFGHTKISSGESIEAPQPTHCSHDHNSGPLSMEHTNHSHNWN